MFGKILVFLHLGLSLMFATWALVLFSNRVDWTNKEGKPGQPDGELRVRMADYDKLAKYTVRPADARFREARAKLEQEEKGRPVERAWFVQQLELLNSAAEGTAIRQIDRNPDGGPIVIANAPAGADLLQMGPLKDKNREGQPLVLKSLDFYNREYNVLVTQESAALKRRVTAAREDIEATDKLKGEKGLHSMIRLEVAKKERVVDEFAEVRPMWLNTAVELKNLEDLRSRLQQRLDELLKLKSKGDKEGR